MGVGQITVWCCGREGCGHKMLGASTVSPPSCPTHLIPLHPILYERVVPPNLKKT